jgi:hypothetical protein
MRQQFALFPEHIERAESGKIAFLFFGCFSAVSKFKYTCPE